jgi:hypothetical protein
MGSVLLRLRKHSKNVSSNSTQEQEVALKQSVFKDLFTLDLSTDVLREFINVTGKKVSSQDELSKLKHKKDLVKIFEKLVAHYSKQEGILKHIKDGILKNLNDRKSEIALISVAYDMDTDMLKSLIMSGQLKSFMSASKQSK